MGVGVPKVPFYCSSEDEKPTWVDLYERLLVDRIIFVCKRLESKFVNQIIGLLMYLTSEDENQDYQDYKNNIFMYINSPGGWAIGSLGLYDIMQTIMSDVYTVNIGFAGSSGSLILVGGDMRMAFPHSRVMIHQPRISKFRARPRKLLLEAEEMFKLRDTIANIYAQKTGKPLSVIQEDLERDCYMSATEAQAYGIVDHILCSSKSEDDYDRNSEYDYDSEYYYDSDEGD